MRVSLFFVVVLGLLAGQGYGYSRETVRGRLNAAGTNQVEIIHTGELIDSLLIIVSLHRSLKK